MHGMTSLQISVNMDCPKKGERKGANPFYPLQLRNVFWTKFKTWLHQSIWNSQHPRFSCILPVFSLIPTLLKQRKDFFFFILFSYATNFLPLFSILLTFIGGQKGLKAIFFFNANSTYYVHCQLSTRNLPSDMYAQSPSIPLSPTSFFFFSLSVSFPQSSHLSSLFPLLLLFPIHLFHRRSAHTHMHTHAQTPLQLLYTQSSSSFWQTKAAFFPSS